MSARDLDLVSSGLRAWPDRDPAGLAFDVSAGCGGQHHLVWSRVATGFRSQWSGLRRSARPAECRTTWAEATGNSWVMPFSWWPSVRIGETRPSVLRFPPHLASRVAISQPGASGSGIAVLSRARRRQPASQPGRRRIRVRGRRSRFAPTARPGRADPEIMNSSGIALNGSG